VPARSTAILHLISEADWERFRAQRRWAPLSLRTEGFVHCTAGDALLLQVANTFYRHEPGQFMVLTIDTTRLDAPVRWEHPPDDDPLTATAFPHVYGPLPLAAVVAVRPALRDDDGTFTGYGDSA